ncbi:MAG: ketoacyl-ACP synthase III [Bacteroidales bacterium]|nr:ketoacyl-ACP synthase III [Bacteroidales bacterium]
MANFTYNNIGIAGLAAAVPKHIYRNLTDNKNFTEEDAAAIVDKTGILERRVADAATCASDLCYTASEQLINEMGIDRNEIDVLIFVSQTPDFRMPATGIILQHRLNLPKSCLAFDVNLGCSGFVIGLNMAYSLLQQDSIRKVLLLNGETRTKVYSFKDRQTGFLFGDAGTACLVDKNDKYGPSWFMLDSDGAKSDYISIKSGGYRNPSTPDSFIEREHENGRVYSDEQGYMDGAGVFEFVITEVPKSIKKILQFAGSEKEEVDFFVFHQANKFMNEHLNRKLKLEEGKVPFSLQKFGNTSSVSIPITIVSELNGKLSGAQKVLISGFGVGLSLGTAILNIDNPWLGELSEI